jgi:pSer/pThr/pTyr-binding forkhead associated (FHA) protein
MRTQSISEVAVGTPCLEHFCDQQGKRVRTCLEKFPFTIGRNETADLRIESNRVSREHAVITEPSRGVYCLRDLKSTNGTFVNGQRIQETRLQDGDLVAVANFELTFLCGRNGAQPYTVTHVMTEEESDVSSPDRTAEFLENLRWAGERLLEGVGAVRFDPIFALHDGAVQGYEAAAEPQSCAPGTDARQKLSDLDCRLALRLRHLDRLLALEEAMQLPYDGPILFRLSVAESAGEQFFASLSALEPLSSSARRVILAIPYPLAKTDSQFRDKVRRARAFDMGLGIYDFPVTGGEDLFRGEDSPEWALFKPGMLQGLRENAQRQKELRALNTAGRDAGSELVVVDVRSAAEAELCRHCGCRLGQGSWRVHVHR